MQAPYRHPQGSPPATSQRRGTHASIHVQQQSQQQQQQQQQQQHQQHQQQQVEMKTRNRKPTEKWLPENMDGLVINPSTVEEHQNMVRIERQVDVVVGRKKLEATEPARYPRSYKTLRIWISNTAEDQSWQANGLDIDSFDFTPNNQPSYRIKIEGRLLHEAADSNQVDSPVHSSNDIGRTDGQSRFSHFFKSLSVDFDQARFRNNSSEQSVEWKKPTQALSSFNNLPPAADFDEFTFKRGGDENMNITLNLYRHEDPERFQYSPELAAICQTSAGTSQEALLGMWEYIRVLGLQEDEDKRFFCCDDLLQSIIPQSETGNHIARLNDYISAHLRPLPPVSLPYTIRVDEEFHKNPSPTIYDVKVLVEDPVRARPLSLFTGQEYARILKDIASLDTTLALIIQATSVSKARHTFLTALSRDPANFVRNWLSSQERDLDLIMGEAPRGGGEQASGDEWRRHDKDGVWASTNARESIQHLLSQSASQSQRRRD